MITKKSIYDQNKESISNFFTEEKVKELIGWNNIDWNQIFYTVNKGKEPTKHFNTFSLSDSFYINLYRQKFEELFILKARTRTMIGEILIKESTKSPRKSPLIFFEDDSSK